ncbi:MAG: hypothetical protein HY760_04190 [Nitrospirae bacterium]|nr:hypothetical protein [Nitrospirota bacterium]
MLETGGGLRSRKRRITAEKTSCLRRLCVLLFPLTFSFSSGCSAPEEVSFLTVSPATATLRIGDSETFLASLASGESVPVTWAVSGAIGGDATHGLISEDGTYSAPTILSESDLLDIPDLVQVQATAEGMEGGSASVHLTTFHENQVVSAGIGNSETPFRADTRSGGQKNIAVFGNRIHVVWSDNREGNSDVYIQTSADGGATFGTAVRVNSETLGDQTHPAVAVHPVGGGEVYEVYIVWEDTSAGNKDIYFSKSVDGGTRFSPQVQVNRDAITGEPDRGPTDQANPALAITPDGILYVGWEDDRNPSLTGPEENTDIYLAVSPDGGTTFPNIRITGGEENASQTPQRSPALASDPQGRVYLVWEDHAYYASLKMNVITRDAEGAAIVGNAVLVATQVTTDLPSNTTQVHPALTAASDRGIFVVWESAELQNGVPTAYDIYLTGSPDGITFSSPSPVRVNRSGAGGLYGGYAYPAITSDEEGTLYLAWEDSRNGLGDQDIYATRSTEGGFSFETARKVNDDEGTWQEKPGIAVRDGKAFVVWSDYRNNPSSTCSPQTCPNDIYSATE